MTRMAPPSIPLGNKVLKNIFFLDHHELKSTCKYTVADGGFSSRSAVYVCSGMSTLSIFSDERSAALALPITSSIASSMTFPIIVRSVLL